MYILDQHEVPYWLRHVCPSVCLGVGCYWDSPWHKHADIETQSQLNITFLLVFYYTLPRFPSFETLSRFSWVYSIPTFRIRLLWNFISSTKISFSSDYDTTMILPRLHFIFRKSKIKMFVCISRRNSFSFHLNLKNLCIYKWTQVNICPFMRNTVNNSNGLGIIVS